MSAMVHQSSIFHVTDPLWREFTGAPMNSQYKGAVLPTAFSCQDVFVISKSIDMGWEPRHPLHWRHNDHDRFSNYQPRGCLLNCLFRRKSKKTSKLRVTGLCVGNSPGPVNSPHKGPVTRNMFPFDDVIMKFILIQHTESTHLRVFVYHIQE